MARLVLVLFWAAAVADVLGLAMGLPLLHWVAKPLLMPLLLAYAVVSADRRKTVRWLLFGLVLAWLADIALLPPGTVWFLGGMALFGAMQVCYIRVFVAVGAPDRMRQRWGVPAVLFTVLVVAVAVLGPAMGWLAVPVTLYGLLLTTMASLAAGVRWSVAVGGSLFVLSDMLIGLELAAVDFAGREPAVMATYTLAQFLIVTGCSRVPPRSHDTSHTPARSRR
ncbi:lysoplasmalogenase [Halostreptopolyspora alba]|uniref:Lysoplasmalogenase n=1 Tax=Halostreptopolyspora alba TaxID=2487137 RepID=A0A3N0E491_9ACTN|nr:lysoplasmalogenase [Nocardiopsaceae bacterium YIM 96095]